jgi:hypothetical protein
MKENIDTFIEALTTAIVTSSRSDMARLLFLEPELLAAIDEAMKSKK